MEHFKKQITIGSNTYNVEAFWRTPGNDLTNEEISFVIDREPVDLELIEGLWERTNPIKEQFPESLYQQVGTAASVFYQKQEGSENKISDESELSDKEINSLGKQLAAESRKKRDSTD
ncbi:hypothetical protein BDD43_2853 [Mucilaginibacter gracilis]|uniref:Uncharacterized protein n=1 Tax=Mucilaginibacter gracilis TaxID=423350 RepID=A0A495J2R8_9SPHI|nr:hypothetical protein [Mucilaginibacter gracilis]RKR82668.1 hypothetical protein BDD43_2853 [Mucilaginibacter gracilis]